MSACYIYQGISLFLQSSHLFVLYVPVLVYKSQIMYFFLKQFIPFINNPVDYFMFLTMLLES